MHHATASTQTSCIHERYLVTLQLAVTRVKLSFSVPVHNEHHKEHRTTSRHCHLPRARALCASQVHNTTVGAGSYWERPRTFRRLNGQTGTQDRNATPGAPNCPPHPQITITCTTLVYVRSNDSSNSHLSETRFLLKNMTITAKRQRRRGSAFVSTEARSPPCF